MKADTPQLISHLSRRFFSGTICSRASGFLRDLALAFAFGAHAHLAAFFVAFRFANLFRRLLAESSLSASFVPFFEEIRQKSPKRGGEFVRDLTFSLLILLIGFLVISETALLSCRSFFSPENREIISLMIPMLPGIAFISLYAISSSLLQCEQRFFLPAFAPSLFNFTWALAACFLSLLPVSTAIQGLAWCTSLAFFVQWLVVFPSSYALFSRTLNKNERFSARLFPKEVRRVIKPFGYGLVGIGAVQINSALDAVFARCASLEGPAHLWYAIRVYQLPLALITVAFSSALLPSLSRAFEREDREGFVSIFSKSIEKCFTLLMPCTVAMILLAPSGLNLLFGRGAFTGGDVVETSLCLCGYAVGLIPYSLALLLTAVFHSRKEYVIPMRASIISVIVNILFNALFVFVFDLGAKSVAIATSLASLVQLAVLQQSLQLPAEGKRADVSQLFRVVLCSVVGGVGTVFLVEITSGDPLLGLFRAEVMLANSFFDQLRIFTTQLLLFLSLFVGSARLLNAEQILRLIIRKS